MIPFREVLPMLAIACLAALGADPAPLRAGAAALDVTPTAFPVLVNGGMTSATATRVKTPLHARALALDDGTTRCAIVIVDSCMMDRAFLDSVKAEAARKTPIPAPNILIGATHTHSAAASMGCLGTDADPAYTPFLKTRLVSAIAAAHANLEPAQVGWARAMAPHHTALRRWILRPDRMQFDPFGNRTVRATMHAGRILDDVTGESGPPDPSLPMISVQARNGRPIALLANFSMHYFSDSAISADYYGLFCEALKARLAPNPPGNHPPFVGIMSHGCSGDIWRRDYRKPAPKPGEEPGIEAYAGQLADIAAEACRNIAHTAGATVAMAEARLPMRYRVPDLQRLEWAQRIVAATGDRLPKTQPEIYAREQVLLHERQTTEVVVQALRLGDMVIATTPCETYALTGLKLKARSPLPKAMVIELANGGDGYIPPPEQHVLGGYNTWSARSAGLETTAEPRIVEAALDLLEKVTAKPRREPPPPSNPHTAAVMRAQPAAYWGLDEMSGPRAHDRSGHGLDGHFEPGVVFHLEGAPLAGDGNNRAAHFAGGRMEVRTRESAGPDYAMAMWIHNGMPAGVRPVSGWFLSRGRDKGTQGDHLGIGGTENPGKLVFQAGNGPLMTGRTEIGRWQWRHVVLSRRGNEVRVYLDGNPVPEIVAEAPPPPVGIQSRLFVGGRTDNDSNWEGRLDEVAAFTRPISGREVQGLKVP